MMHNPPNRAVADWMDYCSMFDLEIHHLPGRCNLIADALSRYMPGDAYDSLGNVDTSNMLKQPIDYHLTLAINDIDVPHDQEEDLSSDPLYLHVKDIHDFGHFGVTSTYNAAKDAGLRHPRLQKLCHKVVHNCRPCSYWSRGRKVYSPLQSVQALHPMDHIEFDLFVMPTTADGLKCFLLAIDVFTSFVWLIPLQDKKAPTVARALWEQIFSRFGPPKRIHSDNEPALVNKITKSLFEHLKIAHQEIATYNPRANGKAERAGRTAKELILKLIHGQDEIWPAILPVVSLMVNEKVHATTGHSPFSLMFARSSSPCIDYSSVTLDDPISFDTWAEENWSIMLNSVYPAVRNRVTSIKDKQSAHFASKHHVAAKKLPIGSTVMLANLGRDKKTTQPWLGPYFIHSIADDNYIVRLHADHSLEFTVPRDQLKPLLHADLEENHDMVEDIIDYNPKTKRYLVVWRDHPGQNTWELADALNPSLIQWYKDKPRKSAATASSNTTSRKSARVRKA